MTILPLSYDPEAKCPKFDAMLGRIFDPLDDAEDTIRHFWELFGQAIQPLKRVPAWVMLYGSGSNGKSSLLRIVQAFTGGSFTPKSIDSLSRDSHAYETIVGKLMLIDDDVRAGARLPDEFLKRTSENGQLEANPKGRKAFTFTSTLTVMLATNRFPSIRDLSEGTRRRAHILPFLQDFKPTDPDYDPHVVDKIIDTELPGILNQAVAGLVRLRKRGHFVRSASCERATRQWLDEANQIARFATDCITDCKGNNAKAVEVFEAYNAWASDERPAKTYGRNSFYGALRDLGYRRQRTPDGVYFLDVRVTHPDADKLCDVEEI